MAQLIKELSLINGVSGDEHRIRKYIIDKIGNKADEITVDAIGNVIALKKGKKSDRKIMVVTNMDECGFIVSGITDKGYLKIKTVGNIDSRVIISKKVLVGEDVKGIIGMKAIHLQKRSERENTVPVSDLFVDIGASSKKNAEKKVSLGTYLTFDSPFYETDETVFGKALDRMGCACVLEAMNCECEYDIYYVFSTQREVCARGAAVAAHRIKPDVVICVDTLESADMHSVKGENITAKLGGGVVINMADKSVISNNTLSEKLRLIAENIGIKMQLRNDTNGKSMSGAAQTAADGAAVCGISIPCRYSHTPLCMMNKNDIKSATALLCAVVEKIGEITNGIIK